MQRYEYTITDTASNERHVCEYEPEGWGDYGVTFGRETGISNVVKGYVASWTFVKGDARWLKNRLIANGPNRRLVLSVYDHCNDLCTSRDLIYRGDIDLTQATWNDSTFSAPTSEGGFFKALENCWDKDVETPIDSYVKMTGAIFGDSSEMGALGIDSGLQGSTSWRTWGYLTYLVPLKVKETTAMNEEFLNAVNLCNIQYSAPDTYDQTFLDTNVFPENPTPITSAMSFFNSSTRIVNSLNIVYDIEAVARVTRLAATRGNIRGKKWKCVHKLRLVGVRKNLIDSQTPFYFESDMSSVQFNRIIGTSTEIIECQHGGGDGNYATYSPHFKGSFVVNNIDANYDGGMYFFLLLNVYFGDEWIDDGTPHYGDASLAMQTGFLFEGISVADFSVVGNTTTVSYKLCINKDRIIGAVKAVDVFRNLIGNANNGRYNVVVDTSQFDSVAAGDLLTSEDGLRMPKERRRGFTYIKHGNVTTSIEKFLQYANAVYGYRMGVNVNNGTYTVYLAPFKSMYSRNSVIGTLKEYNNTEFTIARDMLYSTIRTGHETDEDMFDGNNEYNNVQVWDTPNTEIEGNELDLVCPYSASSKTIETYTYKNYGNRNDTSGESGKVYLVNAKLSGMYAAGTDVAGDLYILDKSYIVDSGVEYPSTQWNIKYTPKRMLEAHKTEFNSYFAFDEGGRISLSVCDHNRTLVSANPDQQGRNPIYVREGDDIAIGSDRVFIPVTLSLASVADRSWIARIEAARTGVFVVEHNGTDIKGYLAQGDSSVTINPIHPKESEFNLLLTEKTGL